MPQQPAGVSASVRFSHIHIYCDSLRTLEEYRSIEAKLNEFAGRVTPKANAEIDVAAGRAAWLALGERHGDPMGEPASPELYKSVGQDIVQQLLVGMGWRVTGSHEGIATRSVALTSEDSEGVKFVVSAPTGCRLDKLADGAEEPAEKRQKLQEEAHDHFSVAHLERYARYHRGRQGVAVLGFVVSRGGVAAIRAKYEELHPKLLLPGSPRTYAEAQVLEVFAYYAGEMKVTDADTGTVIRFVEEADGGDLWILPGLKRVAATFDGVSQSAYCDHWVSNVISRTGFLDTLKDTLGFTPKVDFNAGVVAAGEAQIESTVMGNTPGTVLGGMTEALKDQSQVYLPTNNALSEVGHVTIFLKEIGQGVQHIASRVADLPALIQRTNDYRKMTGAGFTFLQIPRSYYGYLNAKRLEQDAGIDEATAEKVMAALRKTNIVDSKDIVDLAATHEGIVAALPEGVAASVADLVLRARYGNLYMLLRDHISEEAYLRIVRNNILVDIQGEDLLLQIFTAKVLQRVDGEESCFLEFIQRVCSECKDASGCPRAIKPGCGGFGIRNFLTLFLSIEVSKAVAARAEAEKLGDAKAAEIEGKRVEAFTSQLDESNPILTAISDAMTAEGAALERGDAAEAERWATEKAKGNEALQAMSAKYKEIMRVLREQALSCAPVVS